MNQPTPDWILVVGHKGMLGLDLTDALRRAFPEAEVRGRDLPDVDITDAGSVAGAFDATRPDVVINCAAYTDVDGCETNTALAMAVNGDGPGVLAAACRDRGARLVHISTDFIFDGLKGAPYAEDDPPNPLSAYARGKLAGEEAVRREGGDWVIARTAWLYGRHGKNFVDLMVRLAGEREELSVVTDQVGSPTWTRDLAGALVSLIAAGATGVYHTVNAGACSRYEQVEEIVRALGLPTRLKAVDSSAFPRAAKVPAASPLDTAKLTRDTGHVMRPWREALAEYLAGE